jgi:hypothetical protein
MINPDYPEKKKNLRRSGQLQGSQIETLQSCRILQAYVLHCISVVSLINICLKPLLSMLTQFVSHFG